ncbi:Uncharacterized protein Adt_14098 [Abeliophyllum distichum]|uniref:Uncharacterized protein n=1 Tax=Abeliophyllum distichum TaxID=126358 RepID=A0ABD1TYQ0_9LAMI
MLGEERNRIAHGGQLKWARMMAESVQLQCQVGLRQLGRGPCANGERRRWMKPVSAVKVDESWLGMRAVIRDHIGLVIAACAERVRGSFSQKLRKFLLFTMASGLHRSMGCKLVWQNVMHNEGPKLIQSRLSLYALVLLYI